MSMDHGTLGDGSLAQVYREAGTSGLTGQIRVDARTSQGTETLLIVVRQGRVVQVDSPTRSDAWRLGPLALLGGLCAGTDLDGAVELAQAQQRPLGEVLVERWCVEREQLEELLALQFREDLHRSLGWRDGEYRVGSQGMAPRPGEISLDLDAVAQMGLWQLDQWPALRLFVPTNAARFAKAIGGPIPRKVVDNGQLGAQELKLFSLVHQSRSVDDLVRVARIEAFEVCRSLGLLAQAKVIKRHDVLPQQVVAPTVARVSRSLSRHVATAVLICFVLGLGLSVWLSGEGETPSGISVGTVDSWHDALTKSQVVRIENALAVYRSRHGDYPARLGILCEEGLLTEADLRRPFFDNPYTYRSYDNRFMLVRPKR